MFFYKFTGRKEEGGREGEKGGTKVSIDIEIEIGLFYL
jgi:hypothetical protein